MFRSNSDAGLPKTLHADGNGAQLELFHSEPMLDQAFDRPSGEIIGRKSNV